MRDHWRPAPREHKGALLVHVVVRILELPARHAAAVRAGERRQIDVLVRDVDWQDLILGDVDSVLRDGIEG